MDYITPKQAAEQWKISERRVEYLCANGRIEGAERLGDKLWVIPKTVGKPVDGRTKTAKQRGSTSDVSVTDNKQEE